MKIVICLDNSEYSRNMLLAIQPIVNAFKNPEVTIIHIINEALFYATTGAETSLNELLRREGHELEQQCNSILGSNVRFIMEYGQPNVNIDKLLDKLDFDLLIVGAGNPQNIEDRLLGGVSEHLLKITKKPILIIPVKK
jgi:nucleotide-binding universal stress UspA family protein